MTKWHVSKDGTPSVCKAKKKCRLDGVISHGDTKEEVLRKYEEHMEKTHPSQELDKIVENVPRSQRPNVEPEFEDREFSISPQEISVPHDPNAKYAVLSDVDGTLTRGSLVLDHAIYLHDNNMIDLGDLPKKWRKDPKNEKVIVKLAEKYREQISHMSIDDLRVNDFLDSYEQNNDQFYSTLDQLKEFKRRGWEVQLISGSPDFLVSKFAERNGFFGKGSEYLVDENGKLNGKVDGMFGSKAKQGYIEKLCVNRFKRVLAFGDTASDQPLFDNADHSTLVDPNEETASTVEASLIIRD